MTRLSTGRSLRMLCLCFLAFCVGVYGGAAHAQTRAPTPTPTFIAVPVDFPDVEARSMLVREPGRDIVLLRSAELTPEALAMSLLVLDRVRDKGLAPGQGQLIPITGFVMTEPPPVAYRKQLESVLRRLERAPESDIGTIGPGRWIRFR